MIIKKVKNNYKYGTSSIAINNLVNYVNDEKHAKDVANRTNYATKKSPKSWYVNLPQDRLMAIKQMQDTQNKNTRTKLSKVSHYVVSFPVSERPSDKVMIEIEKMVADKLGCVEHERVCAIHDDTAYYHMHIVVNKVHPKTHNMLKESHDYLKMDSVAKEIEQKFGLQVDKRINYNERKNKNQNAVDMEAHTGTESFLSYLQKEFKEIALMAENWDIFHIEAQKIGIKVRLQANGIVFQSMGSDAVFAVVKASSVDRKLSKPALEKCLGAFKSIDKINLPDEQKAINNNAQKNETHNIKINKTYTKQPLHRGSDVFWKAYQASEKNKAEKQKIELEKAKNIYQQESHEIKQLKLQQKAYLKAIKMPYKDRIGININIDIEAKNAQEKAHQNYKKYREQIYIDTKKLTWLAYLMHEAKTDTKALKVLQSTLKYQEKKLNENEINKIQASHFLKQEHIYVGYGLLAKNGEIHYKTIDEGHFKVAKDGIYLIKDTPHARIQALDVAKKSYGSELKIDGSKEFVEGIQKQAKEMKLNIFDNDLGR